MLYFLYNGFVLLPEYQCLEYLDQEDLNGYIFHYSLYLDGLEEYVIPAATWAIFPGNTGNGPRAKAIQELEQRIVTEWLPTSGYSYANGPDIEVYLDANESNMNFEIWIPVNKK